jgi:hypothetical protein
MEARWFPGSKKAPSGARILAGEVAPAGAAGPVVKVAEGGRLGQRYPKLFHSGNDTFIGWGNAREGSKLQTTRFEEVTGRSCRGFPSRGFEYGTHSGNLDPQANFYCAAALLLEILLSAAIALLLLGSAQRQGDIDVARMFQIQVGRFGGHEWSARVHFISPLTDFLGFLPVALFLVLGNQSHVA